MYQYTIYCLPVQCVHYLLFICSVYTIYCMAVQCVHYLVFTCIVCALVIVYLYSANIIYC